MDEPEKVRLADILVGERLRKDYGDLSDLDTITTVGLVQPIVLDKDGTGQYRLVAGGRRLAKLNELGYSEVVHGITSTPGTAGFVYASELPEDVRREIELYENIGRKQMEWQERVLAIAEIHLLKKRRAALDSEQWGLRETGAEVGLDYSSVSYAIAVAEELRRPGSKIAECKGLTDAIRYLAEQRENLAKRQLVELTSKTLPQQSQVLLNNSSAQIEAGEFPPLTVPLSEMLFHGQMEDLSLNFEQTVDHIITDWPYGIDLDYLEQSQGMNVERVKAEHGHTENIASFAPWLQHMYEMLKPKGFCVIWYDNVHWNLMRTLAEQVGFRVQRWPLVWVKTSPCLNQMASKNWTKATEFAMVLSKENATLVKPQSVNYWSGPRASTTSNPFAKPKGLWQWILSAFALQGDVICDPFMGEGSSLLAAIDFGCRIVGFETNENHYNQAVLNVRTLYEHLTNSNVSFS